MQSNQIVAMIYELDNNFQRRMNTGISTKHYSTFEALVIHGVKPLLKSTRCYVYDVYQGNVEGPLLQSRRVTVNTLVT